MPKLEAPHDPLTWMDEEIETLRDSFLDDMRSNR